MLVAREEVEGWIQRYDQDKGVFRRLFGDHKAIRDLKELLFREEEEGLAITDAAINLCFRQHPVKPASASSKVLQAFRAYCNAHTEVQRQARPREAVATRQPALVAPVPPAQDVNPHETALKKIGFDLDNIPEAYLCPVSMRIMVKPACVRSNPQAIYEKGPLQKWVAEKHRAYDNTPCQLTDIDEIPDLEKQINDFVTNERCKAKQKRQAAPTTVATNAAVFLPAPRQSRDVSTDTYAERLHWIRFDGVIPKEYLCRMSGKIMDHPACVMTNPEIICEKTELEKWVAAKKTSPIDAEPCSLEHIQDVPDLKAWIDRFVCQAEMDSVNRSCFRSI